MKIRLANIQDSNEISILINKLGKQFVDCPSGTGAERFFEGITSTSIAKYISNENYSYWVAEHEDDRIVGVVGARNRNHLFHLFVSDHVQGIGIGRKLWEKIFSVYLSRSFDNGITVNSSLNAIDFYKSLGFITQDCKISKDGISFQPMILYLKG